MSAKEGDKVKVHYTGKLGDGRVFDTSRDRQPLEMTVGGGEVIPGFEREIVGMAPGESKQFEVGPEEAYGEKRDELMVDVDKKDFPEDVNPFVGQQLQVRQTDGETVNVRVEDIEGEAVTLDANHPLAGETLYFDVELVEIV